MTFMKVLMWSFMLETVLEKLVLKAGVCGPVEMCLSKRGSLCFVPPYYINGRQESILETFVNKIQLKSTSNYIPQHDHKDCNGKWKIFDLIKSKISCGF